MTRACRRSTRSTPGARADLTTTRTMAECFATLMSDPQAAFGAVVHDRAASGGIYRHLSRLPAGRPSRLRQTRLPRLEPPGHRGGSLDRRGNARGIPGARRADVVSPWRAPPPRSTRFHGARPRRCARALRRPALARMRARLADRRRFDENDALTLLGDAGLPANAGTHRRKRISRDRGSADLGYPVVLKTAKRGLDHKSDQQGIHLGARRTTPPSLPPTATSRSASTHACWSRP